jgi:hypothetical protein
LFDTLPGAGAAHASAAHREHVSGLARNCMQVAATETQWNW